jgi:hypothetical protein
VHESRRTPQSGFSTARQSPRQDVQAGSGTQTVSWPGLGLDLGLVGQPQVGAHREGRGEGGARSPPCDASANEAAPL